MSALAAAETAMIAAMTPGGVRRLVRCGMAGI
jgi:hypothetical protein